MHVHVHCDVARLVHLWRFGVGLIVWDIVFAQTLSVQLVHVHIHCVAARLVHLWRVGVGLIVLDLLVFLCGAQECSWCMCTSSVSSTVA